MAQALRKASGKDAPVGQEVLDRVRDDAGNGRLRRRFAKVEARLSEPAVAGGGTRRGARLVIRGAVVEDVLPAAVNRWLSEPAGHARIANEGDGVARDVRLQKIR